jgi:hypothetical protein
MRPPRAGDSGSSLSLSTSAPHLITPQPVRSRTEDGLVVDTFYLECLAQGSYLVSHDGNAFLIDPRRDVEMCGLSPLSPLSPCASDPHARALAAAATSTT